MERVEWVAGFVGFLGAPLERSHDVRFVAQLTGEAPDVRPEVGMQRLFLFRQPAGDRLERHAELGGVDELVGEAGLLGRDLRAEPDDETPESPGEIRVGEEVHDPSASRNRFLSHTVRILLTGAGEEETAVRIDCDECVMQHTAACDDCVVTFIVNREPTAPVVIEGAEERAVRMLAHAGLVPGLRHVRQVG